MTVTPEIFAAWRAPRLGNANPSRLDNPLWASLVHDRINAWQVNKRFGYERVPGAGPTWCFDGFGQSATTLADGRIVYIAGEHEDYYDPDFYIYNDVVIVAPSGEVAIFGYPREVFPPTDFHSATLLDGAILLVGSLGYAGERVAGVTPVFRLSLATLAIEAIATTGDAPGWIHKHTAVLDGTTLIVRGGMIENGESLEDNIDEWALDLATWQWQRRTQLDWQRFTITAPDGTRSHLFEIRQMLWQAEHPDFKGSVDYRADLVEATGREPDLDVLRALYLADDDTRVLDHRDEDDYNIHRVEIDGVSVQFKEGSHRVSALVEGRLAEPRLFELQQHVLAALSALHNTPWQLDR
ncbi:MAG TPA: hypothetical protein VFQ65_13170 [Kofleriaceae bacterium]|nr:hypothetical protein [Kofleriaceae bacterium]